MNLFIKSTLLVIAIMILTWAINDAAQATTSNYDSASKASGNLVAETNTVLNGATLVSQKCTVCHSSKKYENADKNLKDWTITVDQMIKNGAELNAAEKQAVLDYLVNK